PAVGALISEKGRGVRDETNRLLKLRDAAVANASRQPIFDLRGTYLHLVREPFVRSRFLEEHQHLLDDEGVSVTTTLLSRSGWWRLDCRYHRIQDRRNRCARIC